MRYSSGAKHAIKQRHNDRCIIYHAQCEWIINYFILRLYNLSGIQLEICICKDSDIILNN